MSLIQTNKRPEGRWFTFRVVGISRIQSDFWRRAAMLAAFPALLSFNILAVFPVVIIAAIHNNLSLFTSFFRQWEAPAE